MANEFRTTLVSATPFAVGLLLLYAGFQLYSDGQKVSKQSVPKYTGIALMALGAVPVLPFIAAGLGVTIGGRLFDSFFVD